MTMHTFWTTMAILFLVGSSLSNRDTRACNWHWELNSLIVNCSHRSFTQYPLIRKGIPIERLDLSFNQIQEFPMIYADIKSLIYLDLSNNKIQNISDDALIGFDSLRVLNLTNNNIYKWSDISPNVAFQHAKSLQVLSLASNQFRRFADPKAPLLISNTLTELDLSTCGITQLNNVLGGMPNLTKLILSGNNLKILTSLPSESLRILDVSNSSLDRVYTSFTKSVPRLEELNVAWNPLVLLENSEKWNNLQNLDMSFCHLNSTELSGMPNLKVATLKGNKFQYINGRMFAKNTVLEVLDLSQNDIIDLDVTAFYDLDKLSHLDLSHNEITKLSENQFRHNNALESINLSHNNFEQLTNISSTSLQYLNISYCKISYIDPGIFFGLPALISLDLSNSPISEFPQNMLSMSLKKLDLSMCRLSTIRNTTFIGYPALTSLNLSGNLFTRAFRPRYFKGNIYLNEIWLGANQWICECHNSTFLAFYEYLTEEPQKIKDTDNLRCYNPTEHYGKTWSVTCLADRRLEMWTTILFLFMVFFVVGCYGTLIVVTSCKKFLNKKRERRNLQEQEANQAELEEILRQNRQILEQDAQPNAPGLYDTMLPTYEDALLMPKPNRSSQSMMNLSTKYYKPLPRVKVDSTFDEEEVVLDHQRFRSEEMLLSRTIERTEYIATCRRMSGFEHNPPRRRCFSTGDSRMPPVHLKAQNGLSVQRQGNSKNPKNNAGEPIPE